MNRWLQKGGRVKAITPVAEPSAAYGFAGGHSSMDSYGSYTGNIYAYVVLEFN